MVLDCYSAISVQRKENFNQWLAMFCLYKPLQARPAQAKIQMLTAMYLQYCEVDSFRKKSSTVIWHFRVHMTYEHAFAFYLFTYCSM